MTLQHVTHTTDHVVLREGTCECGRGLVGAGHTPMV